MLTWATLHDVDELPPARHVAYALADLGRPRLEQARLDLEAWRGLSRLGVPAKFLRELIFEPELPEAEPMTLTRAWSASGCLGPLVLVGDVGTAKSHALASWALDRYRAGKLTHWASVMGWPALAAKDLRELHAAMLAKPALILDDVGGGMGDWHKQIIEGLITGRHERGLPTAVAMNATRAEVFGLLGRRAVDRILKEGGTIRRIKSVESMRRSPPEGIDSSQRGEGWRWARWALDAVGFALVCRGKTTDEDGVLIPVELDAIDRPAWGEDPNDVSASYGDALAARLVKPGWVVEAERVRAHLELPVSAAVAEAKAQHEAEETDPVQRLASAMLGKLRADAAREQAERAQLGSRRDETVMANRGRRQWDESTVIPAARLAGMREVSKDGAFRAERAARDRGFWVRKSSDGWEVLHGEMPGRVMAAKCESPSSAWVLASQGFDTDRRE